MTKQENDDNRHRPNVPPLRFRGFTAPWQRKPLGELADFNPFNKPLEEAFYYIDLESVEQGRLTEKKKIDRECAPSRAQRTLNDDDILFQTVRPYQKNHYLFKSDKSSCQWVASTGYALLRPNVDPTYLYSLIGSESINKEVMIRCTGTAYPAIRAEELADIETLHTLSLAEQEKIGTFFRALDELIAAREEELEKLRQMKAALLEAMFPNDASVERERERVTSATAHTLYDSLLDHTLQAWDIVPSETSTSHTPRLRFRGFTDPWQRMALKDICSIKTGELDANAMAEDGVYPFFTCAKQTYKTDTYAFSGEAVLIAGNGEVGLTKYYNGKFNAYQRTYVLQSSRNDIVLRFILNHIEYGLPKRIAPLLFGSAMPYITINTLDDMPIYIPSLAEQKQIGAFFRSQDEGIATATEQIDKLKRIKQACLKQMFV